MDLLYCVAAVSAGTALSPVISDWPPWPKTIGGTALVALAVCNLLRARRAITGRMPDTHRHRARSRHRFVLFFGLTSINPATLVYFASIVTGLSATMTSVVTTVLFVAAVAFASLTWQALLVMVGAVVRRRAGSRFRYLTTIIGNGVVAVLGILMIADVTL